MTRVVIQPSFGLPRFRRNWAHTLDRRITFGDDHHGPALSAAERAGLDRLHPDGTAHFWGATAVHDRRMDRLATGDVVLLTGRRRVMAVGETGLVFRSPGFARALWDPEPGTCPWDNVYSLLHLERTEIPYEAVWALDGFRAGDNFMGLRLLDDAKAASVLAGLGIATRTRDGRFAVGAASVRTGG